MRISLSAYALVAVALAGCVSFESVQNSEPYYEGEFAGDFESLAACITRAWNAKTNAAFVMMVDPSTRRAYITNPPRAFGGAASETTVAWVSDNRARVEYRQAPSLIPPIGWAFESIETCGTQGS